MNSVLPVRDLSLTSHILHALNEASIIAITDNKGTITFVNDMFCKISKYDRDELLGQNHRMLKSSYHSSDFFVHLWRTISRGKVWRGEVKNKAKDGSFYWVHTTIVPFLDSRGKPYQYVSIRTDITERKCTEELLKRSLDQLANSNRKLLDPHHTPSQTTIHDDLGQSIDESMAAYPEIRQLMTQFNEMNIRINQARKRIEHQAYHDALTGLPNRYHIEEYLKRSIEYAKVNNSSLTLLYLDLDRFKLVNDLLGHQVGDLLLKEVAEKLSQTICENGMIGRQGGDEFLIVLEDMNEEEVRAIAGRILDCLSYPFVYAGKEFFISPSIGISMFPKDGNDIESMMKNADTAMYMAKERGKNNFQFYSSEPSSLLSRRHLLENKLRTALKNKEFILNYQPQVHLNSHELRGFEALIRWNNPELGLISPEEFIPIAEETGIITDIGTWVLKEACRQNKAWQEQGFVRVPVSINVSSQQFRDPEFVWNVLNVLKESKLHPQYLEIELTESTTHHFVHTVEKLQLIKQYGIKVAIDDFGTGYSSLSALDQLPIDILKIDRSFIKHILTNPNKAAIAKTIIDLGHNLDFKIIAEGIEEPSQADFLNEHQCHIGQGFLFHPPLNPTDVARHYQHLFNEIPFFN
ncbi:sensor domain-containing protein [Alkalihalophilus marmarensis]|uniref:PAS domain S-box-containing protein/diguanylate cyclase (GGDEF) domain-containing protein n=1 Tax=Alkalihalophilus marmarensis DSM 21297 TaxID=1188261 RepID=U6SK70_9BACI|nr:GGDEF and EAL domain-containing protein [Alkalihalophilus marmarensis]ERN51782.1 hypothetical protein A33I_19450 [Alkalihalophilus marmarensis DSM 21297]